MKNHIIASIIATLLVYFAYSFYWLTIDFSKWTFDARAMFLVLWAFLLGMANLIATNLTKK
jgi:multidrug resistance efflux pump